MGLDMYIRHTTQKEWDANIAHIKKSQEYDTRANELWNNKWSKIIDGLNLPKTEYGSYDVGKFTPEQNKTVEEYRVELYKIREELGLTDGDYDEDSTQVEIGYWRKAWALHDLIVKVTNTTGNDNCERMLLTKDMCKEIIAKIANGLKSTGKYDFWDNEHSSKYTIDVMKEAIKAIDDGRIVYYLAWY